MQGTRYHIRYIDIYTYGCNDITMYTMIRPRVKQYHFGCNDTTMNEIIPLSTMIPLFLLNLVFSQLLKLDNLS